MFLEKVCRSPARSYQRLQTISSSNIFWILFPQVSSSWHFLIYLAILYLLRDSAVPRIFAFLTVLYLIYYYKNLSFYYDRYFLNSVSLYLYNNYALIFYIAVCQQFIYQLFINYYFKRFIILHLFYIIYYIRIEFIFI